ncbi:hypothetical protein [Cohnella sp.]|uniref:hypothetical protein n=1 Tax=Cohnella sp. TaxID=1883426 RepID=UPI003564C462
MTRTLSDSRFVTRTLSDYRYTSDSNWSYLSSAVKNIELYQIEASVHDVIIG